MRVLTFNSHQPYIHLLATTMPWEIGVVIPHLPSGNEKAWDYRIRPLPPNVRLYASVDSAIRERTWDWILNHNANDLIDCRELNLPRVFLVHGTLRGRILQDRSSVEPSSYLRSLRRLLETQNCQVVFISQLKQEDWGLPGRIIRTAVDPAQYGGYRGDRRGILRVCNHLRERGSMLGWDAHCQVCDGLPSLVLGRNRGLSGSRPANSWEDLKEQYRSHRVYLSTAVYPFEDGYNLAMLEAMATGMPVAVMENPSSPIEHECDGIVGQTASELRKGILRLLDNPAVAARMGAAARVKLEKEFPLADFISSWQSLASSLV